MNMKIFIYTLFVALFVIGVWTLLEGNFWNDTDASQKDSNVLILGKNGRIEGKYALKDIISIDEPYKCEFEKKDSDSKIKGEIFIAPGSKVRGDFSIESSVVKNPFKSHFIKVDDLTYTWTSLLDIGFVSNNKKAGDSDSDILSTHEKIDYDCSGWEVDRSKFQIPGDIMFKDMNR